MHSGGSPTTFKTEHHTISSNYCEMELLQLIAVIVDAALIAINSFPNSTLNKLLQGMQAWCSLYPL